MSSTSHPLCAEVLVVFGLIACSSPATPVTPATPSSRAVAHDQAPSHVDRGFEPPEPALRLPRNFLPASYAAKLAIDPARTGFDGTVAITGEVSQRSSVIWLHSRQLTIKRAVATRAGSEIPLTATPHDSEMLELRATTPLDPGSWTVTIDYAGEYDELNTSAAFKQIVRGAPYVYSQLEATHARRVFPCFDEPDNKVPWKLTLEVPAQLVAVSNTPVVREQVLDGGRKRVEFAATKPLPSYLVAFGVGPFDIVDAGTTRRGTPVRMITMKDRAAEAAWAARTTPRIIDLLEELFGSPYPYEKMDILTIPITVGFGAMENVGLITFAETSMLLDPKHASKNDEYAWVFVVAHELAHQWFGNLVTMAWWDDIWLNESFANWAERKISARFAPAWHEELTVIDSRNLALVTDRLVSARQIRQPIVTSHDILNAFDSITYEKGASVLNMFEGYLGRDVFLHGVRAYLDQHAFGNATSADFLSAVSTAAGKDVGAAFTTFLEQPGAPEITATLVCETGRPPRVALSQQRYVPPGAQARAAGRPWIVPVCVAFDRNGKRAETCSLLDAPTGSLTLDAPSCPRWMMPNLDGRGYYRNAYTAAQVVALRDQGWPQLEASERSAAFFDISEAATLGKLPLGLALSFVPRLLAVGDRFSIRAALDLPLLLRDHIPQELRASYEAWLRRAFGSAARRAGLLPNDSDSLDVEVVRGNLIEAVGNVARDPVLLAEAVKLAGTWRDLPPAIRGRVLALAAGASPKVFERLLAEVYTEPDRARRREIVSALGMTRDLEQQRTALALVLDSKLDIRDTQSVLFGASSEANRRNAQQFFKDNKDVLMKRLPSRVVSGQAFVAEIFTASCAPERRDEITDYVTQSFAKLPGGARFVQKAIEGMDQCIARHQLVEPEIRRWLAGGRATAAAAKASN